MNNEEKILAMLEQMNGRMDKMHEDISGIKSTQRETQADISDLKEDVAGIKLRLELNVEKRFDAVNEGIDSILAQLTPKSRVDELESDVVVLKTAVKMLTQEVAELKKAQ